MRKKTENPLCRRTACAYINSEGECRILSETDDEKKCGFFKTKEQALRDQIRSMEMIRDCEDLIEKYHGGEYKYSCTLVQLKIELEELRKNG